MQLIAAIAIILISYCFLVSIQRSAIDMGIDLWFQRKKYKFQRKSGKIEDGSGKLEVGSLELEE